MLTLSDMPKSSRTFTNAALRVSPEWDAATLTMSRRKDIAAPLCSRWTVRATKARLLGELQASVAKLRRPSYSWIMVSVL